MSDLWDIYCFFCFFHGMQFFKGMGKEIFPPNKRKRRRTSHQITYLFFQQLIKIGRVFNDFPTFFIIRLTLAYSLTLYYYKKFILYKFISGSVHYSIDRAMNCKSKVHWEFIFILDSLNDPHCPSMSCEPYNSDNCPLLQV